MFALPYMYVYMSVRRYMYVCNVRIYLHASGALLLRQLSILPTYYYHTYIQPAGCLAPSTLDSTVAVQNICTPRPQQNTICYQLQDLKQNLRDARLSNVLFHACYTHTPPSRLNHLHVNMFIVHTYDEQAILFMASSDNDSSQPHNKDKN